MIFWTAFTIGLFGSLHCIGMCGPIALAMPLQKKSRFSLLTNSLLYNFGRAITYSFLGVFIGIIGEGIVFAGLQKVLSILTGVMLLGMVFFSVNLESKIISFPFFNQFYLRVKNLLGHYLRKNTKETVLAIGLLNGLLPCGLVYLAMVGALSAESILGSSLYMFSFGLGTMPLMLLFLLLGNGTHQKYRLQLRRLYPTFLTLLALWFIYRGANFYLPPDFKLSAALQYIPMCH
ncbi:MAG: sulfite exporter TauE/SafE family protein [Saprospiraceae bacterium]